MPAELIKETFLPKNMTYRSIMAKKDVCYALMRVNKRFYSILKDGYQALRIMVADNNSYDKNTGNTQLIKAILYKHVSQIDTLLANGANPNKTAEFQFTPPVPTDFFFNSMFHLMGRNYYPSTPVYKLAPPHKTPLIHAVLRSDYETCKKLIDHGAHKNSNYRDMTNDERIWKLLE